MFNNIKRKWKIYLLHHSHTDIGYTSSQEEITSDHIDYIRQATNILNSSDSFKWICETLWGVERFLGEANENEITAFAEACKKGRIGLSSSYLNMTELINEDIYKSRHEKVFEKLNLCGISTPKYALTSDVNGYSWGYADFLSSLGTKGLITQINATHGKEPLEGRQKPFIWEGPKGGRVTVWIAEHYHTGNFLGLEPFPEESINDALERAAERLPEYLKGLEERSYPYDFCPIGISGYLTDNAPPNINISKLAESWNLLYGGKIELIPATLEDFFEKVDATNNLPVYKGDFTDWWADGIASTPEALKLFKEAQRMLLTVKRLCPENMLNKELYDKCEYALTMFAEHTWGYDKSVSHPSDPMVYQLEAKKTAYAAEAHRTANILFGSVLESMGKPHKSCFKKLSFFAKNIGSEKNLACTWTIPYAQHFEGCNALSDESGAVYPADKDGEKLFSVIPMKENQQKGLVPVWHKPFENAEKLLEINQTDGKMHIESDSFGINIDQSKGGVVSITDKNGRELVRNGKMDAAFRPIYEITPLGNENVMSVRGKMGLSRRSIDTLRYDGRLLGAECIFNGMTISVIRLNYELKDDKAAVELIFRKGISSIEAKLILEKSLHREPENLFLSLPFVGNDETLFIDKMGCLLRPGDDNLPSSCTDFYSVQSGITAINGGHYTSVALPDTPLIWLGELKNSKENQCKEDIAHLPLYSWIMNNYWETNFKAEVSGLFEFRYILSSDDNDSNITKEAAFNRIYEDSEPPVSFVKYR